VELRHLRYFVAIGEEENYRRAAQRLRVAPTALSTQIQDLEAELGFKLFDRLPRGVKLSVAGRLCGLKSSATTEASLRRVAPDWALTTTVSYRPSRPEISCLSECFLYTSRFWAIAPVRDSSVTSPGVVCLVTRIKKISLELAIMSLKHAFGGRFRPDSR
jgi:Bacterial regulatory helix-turn-helix protein, lysR family